MSTSLYADSYLDKLKNDVMPLFYRAIALREVDWRGSYRAQVLAYFVDSGYAVDFDMQLQNWARIIGVTDDLGYLWRDFPLLMIKECSIITDLTACFPYLNIVPVADLKTHNINIRSMTMVCNYLDFRGDIEGFSAYEMYMDTNSRE